MSNDTATLYHPHTGRAIDVAGRQADDWRALGWLDAAPIIDDAPEGDAGDPGDGDQNPDNDAPEGDAPADPAGDEADAPAPAATKTTTRGRAKK